MTTESTSTTILSTKCMNCGLHFNVYTWEPDRHSANTLYCPECGQHEGRFMVWRADVTEPIFVHVPYMLDKMEELSHPQRDEMDSPTLVEFGFGKD